MQSFDVFDFPHAKTIEKKARNYSEPHPMWGFWITRKLMS